MDNDNLRRGKPTCHVKFDEATAILAGDGLLSLAFEVLCGRIHEVSPLVRCALTANLAKAIGVKGMVGGQMLDLIAEKKLDKKLDVTKLQRMKTGALIDFSCQV